MDVNVMTTDGARLAFPCVAGQDVLSAAEAAGVFLPAMCHEGSCGLCGALVREGAYEMGPHTPDAMPKDPGGVLLCRCLPQADVTIALPYAQDRIRHEKIPERAAVIESLAPAGAGAMALALRYLPSAEYGTMADFIPGQYMQLENAEGVRRAYSLANLPNWEGRLEFIIRLRQGGAFSTWLGTQAELGDVLTVCGPEGRFVMDDSSLRPRVLVGGGCGVAPILALLRQMVQVQDSLPVHLVFGANREEELFAPDMIAALGADLPQLSVDLAVWRPGPDWHGFTGTAAEALDAYLVAHPEEPDIYVCGPPRLLDAVTEVVRTRKIAPERIIAERI
jgi:NAD(P)H-flavin reductase/ferredoxin